MGRSATSLPPSATGTALTAFISTARLRYEMVSLYALYRPDDTKVVFYNQTKSALKCGAFLKRKKSYQKIEMVNENTAIILHICLSKAVSD